MNPLKEIIEQKRSSLASGAPITQDSYERWLDNECTKRFMGYLEMQILEAHLDMTQDNASSSIVCIGVMTDLTMWKPLELEK